MKAKVIKAYICRITGELHKTGEEVELTEARVKELAEGGFVELIEAPKRTRKTATKKVE